MPNHLGEMGHHFNEIWAPTQYVAESILACETFPKEVKVVVMPYGYSKPTPLTSESDITAARMYIANNIDTIISDLHSFNVTRKGGGTPRHINISESTRNVINTWKHPSSISHRKTVFCSIFDFYSYMIRKNILGTLQAFKTAFLSDPSKSEDVMLLVKSTWSSDTATKVYGDKVAAVIEDIVSIGGKVLWIDGVVSDSVLFQLKSAADCYVSLHRSEGWGLNLFESLLAGIPVLATMYGGSEQFMTLYDGVLPQLRVPYKLTNVCLYISCITVHICIISDDILMYV